MTRICSDPLYVGEQVREAGERPVRDGEQVGERPGEQ
jgi:hypothetical protein